jgi:hypothetical protein
MDDAKALQAILDKLDGMGRDISGIKSDISAMKADIAEIKEDAAVTRGATNALLDWAEKAQVQVQIPLFQKHEG